MLPPGACDIAALEAMGDSSNYKMSLQFDNPQSRLAHGYPIDPAQNEVKQMIKETENSGLPYPEMKP
jgi:hypothetical protein